MKLLKLRKIFAKESLCRARKRIKAQNKQYNNTGILTNALSQAVDGYNKSCNVDFIKKHLMFQGNVMSDGGKGSKPITDREKFEQQFDLIFRNQDKKFDETVNNGELLDELKDDDNE